MTYALGAILLAAALFLTWLIVTRRWQFPLLFDAGLTLLVLGISANGIHLLSDSEPNLRAWLVAGAGAVVMLTSYARQAMRWNRESRRELREIDMTPKARR